MADLLALASNATVSMLRARAFLADVASGRFATEYRTDLALRHLREARSRIDALIAEIAPPVDPEPYRNAEG